MRKNKAAQTLGRRGGRAGTAKQRAARQRNVRRAGRPSRVCIHCTKAVVGGHRNRKLDKVCGAHGWTWKRREGVVLTPEIVEAEIAMLQALFMRLVATQAGTPPDVQPIETQPAADVAAIKA